MQHIKLFLLAFITQIILDLFLFLRPSPFGKSYVIDLLNYLPHTIFYSAYGLALLTIPFIIITIIKKSESKSLYYTHTIILTISLLFSQFDHELLRFMGTHFSINLFSTYILNSLFNTSKTIYYAIRDDAGGPFLSAILHIIPFIFLTLSIILQKYPLPLISKTSKSIKIILFTIFFITTIALPAFLRTPLFGSKNRQEKVAPPIITAFYDIKSHLSPKTNYTNIEEKIATIKNKWLEINTDPNWIFDPNPLSMKKSYKGTCPKFNNKPYNFILISIETARAWNLKLFNNKAITDPTPFLTKLATLNNSAYFKRHICNGQPTIFAFMAMHTSTPPHSFKTVAKAFTDTNLYAFPLALRAHGYETYYYAGSDPDWDNQSYWANQWYGHLIYNPTDEEQDRRSMHNIAKILKNRDHSKPFLLTTFLISNHIPFHSPEPKFDLFHDDNLQLKIYNTLHYDDDVIREFFDAIKNEPFFENTIFIITGDHGYDLAERGQSLGHDNSRHETTWVPLIIHGNHPLITPTTHNIPTSHIDIAPTILNLAGICDEQAFFGHSIFSLNEKNYAPNIKNRTLSIQTQNYSAYMPPQNKHQLFHATDMLQQNDIAKNNPETLKELHKFMKALSTVVDYLYEYPTPQHSQK